MRVKNLQICGARIPQFERARDALQKSGKPVTAGHFIAAASTALIEKLASDPEFHYDFEDRRLRAYRIANSDD